MDEYYKVQLNHNRIHLRYKFSILNFKFPFVNAGPGMWWIKLETVPGMEDVKYSLRYEGLSVDNFDIGVNVQYEGAVCDDNGFCQYIAENSSSSFNWILPSWLIGVIGGITGLICLMFVAILVILVSIRRKSSKK